MDKIYRSASARDQDKEGANVVLLYRETPRWLGGRIYKSAVSPQTFLLVNYLEQQKCRLLEICCCYKFVSFAWKVILGTFAALR